MTSHRGPLSDTLRAALADLADCAPGDVHLDLKAPDLDPDVEVEVSLRAVGTTADDAAGDAGEPATDEVASTPDTPRDEPTPRAEGEPTISMDELDEEADAAADFLEGLLDSLELPGDLKIRVHADHAEVEIVDVNSGALIGRRGQTLEAIQELVRCALQREFQRRARVKVEVEGYRARRMEKLEEKAREAIESVLDTGDSERLEPMDVFERKTIHRLVAEYDGVTSRSQGREPARRIIIERT